MPYDRSDPAAWWKDAEPMPPRPDEPGVTPAAPVQPPPDANALGVWLQPGPRGRTVSFHLPPVVPQQPAEVRVGDRVRPAPGTPVGVLRADSPHDPSPSPERQPLCPALYGDRIVRGGITARVTYVHPAHEVVTVTDSTATYPVRFEDIGPPGSGKPWTVLPREAPLSSASRPLIATARVDAAHDVLRARAVGPVSWNAVCEAVRAADAADLRREALERVAEAARRCVYGSDQRLSRDYARLRAAVVALAALYGKRRP